MSTKGNGINGNEKCEEFSGSSTTGIAANLLNRKFLGIDKETDFLNLSKERKQEIENPRTFSAYRKKLVGFLDNKQLELFLVNEPDILYERDLIFKDKNSE